MANACPWYNATGNKTVDELVRLAMEAAHSGAMSGSDRMHLRVQLNAYANAMAIELESIGAGGVSAKPVGARVVRLPHCESPEVRDIVRNVYDLCLGDIDVSDEVYEKLRKGMAGVAMKLQKRDDQGTVRLADVAAAIEKARANRPKLIVDTVAKVREQYARGDSDGFVEEAAVQCGFEYLDDDAEYLACDAETLADFAMSIKYHAQEAVRSGTTIHIPVEQKPAAPVLLDDLLRTLRGIMIRLARDFGHDVAIDVRRRIGVRKLAELGHADKPNVECCRALAIAAHSLYEHMSDDVLPLGPSPSSQDGVVEANRQLLLERSVTGIRKYGVTLAAANLQPAQLVQHLLEELLDGANYAQALLQTLNEKQD